MTLNKHVFNRTVYELFEEQVKRTPHLMAVQDEKASYSYCDLNRKVNQIAHWLLRHNIKPHDFIAILLEPSVDFVICMLAIIKIKSIYVPLDAMAPQLRLKAILEDANPKLIITNDSYQAQLGNHADIRLIKNIYAESAQFSEDNLPNNKNIKNGHAPIYLMYTSGSTGKPKGILIPQHAVVNLVKIDNYARIKPKDNIAQFSNLAFDACTFEIWSALLNGALLKIVPLPVRTDPNKLAHFLETQAIDCFFLPTGYFHQLIKSVPETLNTVKLIIVGGEQINPVLVRKFLTFRKNHQNKVTLINGYGPTEATTFTCRHVLTEDNDYDDEELMSIGSPISHVKTYILNEHNQQASEGELCISGINLALGYRHPESKSQNKFITNPFETHKTYERLYKTGDKVRLLPSGKLLCLGRLDDQVKIGGFRVHLNEVENELMKHEAISNAVVTVEVGSGDHKLLTAYLVLSSKESLISADEIRAFLSKRLPAYMLPTKYLAIDEFPLTTVGKVDKKNLDKLSYIDLNTNTEQLSSNEIEESIKKIWQNLLNSSSIEVNKNLFELGANSLLMLEACTRINNALNKQLQIADLLTYPTIRRLCQFIEGTVDRTFLRKQPKVSSSDIAVVGMSCRFPYANSIEEFWENLCEGRVSLDFFSAQELIQAGIKSTQENYVPVKGILTDIELFDAQFFGFNPVDASITDPQQRLFLECAWEALEQANVVPSQMAEKTISVFAGMADSTYLYENLMKNSWAKQELDRFQATQQKGLVDVLRHKSKRVPSRVPLPS